MFLPWGNHVVAGVTEREVDRFQPMGLSLGATQDINNDELTQHRQFFADSLGVPFDCLKFQSQVHGNRIIVTNIDSMNSESDGMITNKKGIILNVLVADCCGILLYDQINQAVGALHSGWRGTYLNIAAKGVLALREHYSSKPEYLTAYLSPCASGDKYVVRHDVAKLFPTASKQISEDQYLFDNRKRIKEQLLEIGLRPENITVSTECSIQNISFHSFRRDQAQSGRTSVFIGLK